MILIAYDGSEDAKTAVQTAGKLFPGSDATVVTVWHRLIDTMARSGLGVGTIVDYDSVDEATEKQSLQTAKEGAALAEGAGLVAKAAATVADTSTADAVLHAAAELDADAIVIGPRGLGDVKSLLLGSVTHHLLAHSERPVVVVPSAADESD